jgi:hypothetical protein
VENKKPRRPPTIFHVDNGTRTPIELARAKETVYIDRTKDSGQDLLADRDALVWGYFDMFGRASNKEQAEIAMKLGIWLFKYSRWIKSRPEGKV